jgi:hypothetical protein
VSTGERTQQQHEGSPLPGAALAVGGDPHPDTRAPAAGRSLLPRRPPHALWARVRLEAFHNVSCRSPSKPVEPTGGVGGGKDFLGRSRKRGFLGEFSPRSGPVGGAVPQVHASALDRSDLRTRTETRHLEKIPRCHFSETRTTRLSVPPAGLAAPMASGTDRRMPRRAPLNCRRSRECRSTA